jgi:hypothetical protein
LFLTIPIRSKLDINIIERFSISLKIDESIKEMSIDMPRAEDVIEKFEKKLQASDIDSETRRCLAKLDPSNYYC